MMSCVLEKIKQWPEQLSSIFCKNKHCTSKPTVELESDLRAEGYTVLEDFPDPRSDMHPFRDAMGKNGLCIIRGRLLALRVSNDTKTLSSNYPSIFEEFLPFLCAEDDKSSITKHEDLSSGETHAAVHVSFIDLMKLPNVETLIFLVTASNQFMF